VRNFDRLPVREHDNMMSPWQLITEYITYLWFPCRATRETQECDLCLRFTGSQPSLHKIRSVLKSISYQLMEVRSKGTWARCANGIEGNDAVQRQAYLLGCCDGSFQHVRMSDKNRCFGRGKLIGQFFGGISWVGAAS